MSHDAATPTQQIAPVVAGLLFPFGAIEIGSSISMMLLGIATLQTWNYFRNYPKDPIGLKFTVASVYAADAMHSVFYMHVVYHWTIQTPVAALLAEDINPMLLVPWSLDVSLVLVTYVLILVQSSFCLRVYRITQSRVLALGCWILALARMCLNLSLTGQLAKSGTLLAFDEPVFKWQTVAELVVGMVSDGVIAACLCRGLLRHRSGFLSTDKLVDKLVAFTIGTGLLTSVSTCGELITYLTMPENYIWSAFFSVISKLFSNSLLASLNQRKVAQEPIRVHDSSAPGTTHIAFRRGEEQTGLELTTFGDSSGSKTVFERKTQLTSET